MSIYAFQLGRKQQLCLAELLSILGKNNLVESNREIALFYLPSDLTDPHALQNRLGGTIKIIEIFNQIPANHNDEKIFDSIESELKKSFTDHEGKLPFAVSILGNKHLHSPSIKTLLNFSKKIIKSLGVNSRFINKDFRKNPKPSTIFKAKAIKKGIDLNLIKGDKTIYLGKSITIQNIDNYTARDYEKPARDAKIGMLPPKLAQIMINLATNNKKNLTIYDPFCGTGTILMEGLLMGNEVVGSDLNPDMTRASQKNCEWIKNEYETENNFRIFERDARFITPKVLPEKIDAVVTESYLGTPLEKPATREQADIIFRELANLHLNWLKSIHSVTPASCPVISCIAAIKTTDNRINHLPKLEEIAKFAGYKITNSYSYDRPDQIVTRDIVILKKY